MLITYYKDLNTGSTWTTNEYIPPTCKRATLKHVVYHVAAATAGVFAVRSTSFRTSDNLVFSFLNSSSSMTVNTALETNISGSVKFDIVALTDDIAAPSIVLGVISFTIEYLI